MNNRFFSLAVAISLSALSCVSRPSNTEVPSQDSLNLDSLKLTLDSLKEDSLEKGYIYEND